MNLDNCFLIDNSPVHIIGDIEFRYDVLHSTDRVDLVDMYIFNSDIGFVRRYTTRDHHLYGFYEVFFRYYPAAFGSRENKFDTLEEIAEYVEVDYEHYLYYELTV